jgi:hypothetical protein
MSGGGMSGAWRMNERPMMDENDSQGLLGEADRTSTLVPSVTHKRR